MARRAPLLLVAVALATGCKTRLYDLDGEWEGPGSSPRDAAVDLSERIDLAVRPDHCGVHPIETTHVVRADLLVVLDRSRSMNEVIGGQSKWDLVRSAIKQVVGGTLSVDWGLSLFGSDDRCNTNPNPEVPVGPGKAATIRQVLDGAAANASTPTAAAMRNALAYFRGRNDGHPHYILLATDGQPGCANGPGSTGRGGDDAPATIAAVAAAADAGVLTFVVGIGSNTGAEQTLSEMAKAGRVMNTTPGQPAWYPVTSGQDLVKILEQAAVRITPCSYPVTVEPPDRDRVTIQGSNGVIPRDRTHTDGWDYSEDGSKFVFHGRSCQELQGGFTTGVRAIYACADR